jgi:asparagine synthase (glutamine-hydrolysing)
MCGLAAVVAPDGVELPQAVRAMTRLIRHRGPDDEGFLFAPLPPHRSGGPVAVLGGDDMPADVLRHDGPGFPRQRLGSRQPDGHRLAMGHRRLSIVDVTAAGHQPMCDATGRYWIVYNGEVYNHVELRRELESLGRRFHSRTDTEVILNAYAQWGPDCQDRFNGMWAFLVYDASSGELFGSRDRFGVKPLYYTRAAGGCWAFASEVKQFSALPGWSPKLHWQHAYEFLAWGLSEHDEQSLIRGVFQLPPGGCFRFRLDDVPRDRLPVERWYALPQRRVQMDMREAAAKLRDLLDDAVRLRLRADVPVGSCLSGGLDSSSIVCLVNRQLAALGAADRQRVVSSCSEVARFDERRYVDEVARQTGVRVHHVFPRYETVLETLPDLTWTQDAPYGSLGIFAQWHVFAEARRQGLTVMLDGQGADEEFAGYHDFFGAWLAELLLQFRWVELAREWAGTARRHGFSSAHLLKLLVRHAPLPAAVKLRIRGRFGGRPPLVRDFLRDGGFTRHGVCPVAAAARTYQEAPNVRDKSIAQIAVTNLPALLRYEDRNSMAHSIESRVPFLDYRVVEHALSLPGSVKLRRGETKAVLRRAMDGILPPAIANRQDKLGFATPESVEFTTRQAVPFRDALGAACRRLPELFDERAALGTFDAVLAGRRSYDSSIWRAVCFTAWAERFGIDLADGQSEQAAQRFAA